MKWKRKRRGRWVINENVGGQRGELGKGIIISLEDEEEGWGPGRGKNLIFGIFFDICL